MTHMKEAKQWFFIPQVLCLALLLGKLIIAMYICQNQYYTNAYSIFYSSPIVGGYLNKAFSWRSAFYFVAAYDLFIWLLILFFLPETWRPLPDLTQQPQGKKKSSLTFMRKSKKVDPFGGLRFFKNINIALTVRWVFVISHWQLVVL